MERAYQLADTGQFAVIKIFGYEPPGAFVDPELERDSERCVDDALDMLIARASVAADGSRLRIGDQRADRRFPGVADTIAYQAAFLGETIAALRALAR